MKKSRARILKRISMITATAVFCTGVFTVSALAASPQKNSSEVTKALLKMQKELTQKEHMSSKKANAFGPIKPKSCKVKQPANPPTVNIGKTGQQVELSKQQGKSEIKETNTKTKAETEKLPVKAVVKSKDKTAIQDKQKQSKPSKTPLPGSAIVIKAISLQGNELDVSYGGTLNYNVLQDAKQKIIALDIIAPSLLPPQFASSFSIKLTPSQKGPVRYAIAYFHRDKKDRLFSLYHKPFLRVSLYLRSFNGYKTVKLPGTLKLLVNEPAHHNKPEKVLKKPAKKPVNGSFASKSIARKLSISLKSISRIVSPYPIKQVIYSKEQRIQVQADGENIYIKPLPTKILLPDGSFALQYSKDPKDIYVITDKKVYSLHLVPEDIPSVTYKLKPVKEDNKEISLANKLLLESLHGGKSQRPAENGYIAQIIYLLQQVYTGDLPPDYTLLHLKNSFTISGKYDVKGEFEVSTGEGSVDIYKVTALENGSVDERDFVPYLDDVSAVMLTSRHLLKGESAYLYTIYAGGEYEE